MHLHDAIHSDTGASSEEPQSPVLAHHPLKVVTPHQPPSLTRQPNIRLPTHPCPVLLQHSQDAPPYALHLEHRRKDPAVGFGTWQAGPHEVERAVETTLRSGYRHIDCAAIYRNEAEVGEGIRKSGVPRSDIFLAGKLWNTKHKAEDVESAVDKTLKDLGDEVKRVARETGPENLTKFAV